MDPLSTLFKLMEVHCLAGGQLCGKDARDRNHSHAAIVQLLPTWLTRGGVLGGTKAIHTGLGCRVCRVYRV